MWSDDADLSGNLARSAYGPIYYGSSSGSRRSHTFSVVVVETSTVCDKRIIILHAFVRCWHAMAPSIFSMHTSCF